MKTTPIIRFNKSDSDSYFEADFDDLGIDQVIINHYGSLEQVLDDVVSQPDFVKNGYNSYQIIWQT